ncbi:MAG: MBL fold metallo-hydrolase [Candidatus Paceibacterota bacterium]
MKKPRVISGLAAAGIIIGSLILVLILVQLAIAASNDELVVSFLDVGQGDATLIETPSGVQVLIDGGRFRSVDRALSRALPFYDRSIDMIIATHADADHIGGLVTVLEEYDVGHVILPAQVSETSDYMALLEATTQEKSEGATVRQVSRGDVVSLGDEAYLQILFPLAGHVPADTNDSSLIMKLIYGETSWLFTGDSSQVMEGFVVGQLAEQIDVDVLKVGHHGSDTSSDESFLAAASPAFAVISAGANNPYGHPTDTVLGRLVSIGAETLCTCDLGTIVFISNGREVRRQK